MSETVNRELVSLYAGLPMDVLDALIRRNGWMSTDTTSRNTCAYCVAIENGEDVLPTRCEHWQHYDNFIEPAMDEFDEAHPDYAEVAWRTCMVDEPDSAVLPVGYYAVPDPRPDVLEMTYWRSTDYGRTKWPRFEPWPARARYGPILMNRDIPDDLGALPVNAYARGWYEVMAAPYRAAIIETIAADPIAAMHEFSDFQTRCCLCGRALSDEHSKVYGIGPECRRGLSRDVLDNYFRSKVGEVHARVWLDTPRQSRSADDRLRVH